MAAEFSANALQTVPAGQAILFTENPVPCTNGLVFNRDGSGIFLLANMLNTRFFNGVIYGCDCNRRSLVTDYLVSFHGNIGLPAGGTVEEIQLAIAQEGEADPSSIMRSTPAAVETFENVGTGIIVSVPSICGCASISVRNTSTQPIDVQNANLIITPLGVRRI